MPSNIEVLKGFKTRLLVPVVAALLAGCAGAGEGAVRGAGAGALAGAASGLLSALVWGGDPGYHMARGATAGATIGAIGGAVEGSSRAKAEKDQAAAQEQREIDMFRRDIGDDAFDGVVALAECKHEVAIANGRVATESKNSNHALAGLWVLALSYADQGDTQSQHEMATEIVRWDRAVDDMAAAEKGLEDAHRDLMDIRSDYNLPRTCGA